MAHDELSFHFEVMRGVRPIEDVQQGLHGHASHLPHWLPDGGERWLEILGEVQVVKADHRQIFGNGKAAGTDLPHGAEGRHVVIAEHCGGPLGQREQLGHGLATTLGLAIAVYHQFLGQLEAGPSRARRYPVRRSVSD